MFLNILKIFVTLISFSCITTSSSFAVEQERFALYIPSNVLKKETISGLEITEVTSSSPSMGIFIFYQMYKPSSIANEFNGTQITHTL